MKLIFRLHEQNEPPRNFGEARFLDIAMVSLLDVVIPAIDQIQIVTGGHFDFRA